MPVHMGRRRQRRLDLPPLMHCRVRGGSVRYYYGRQNIALGGDFTTALRRYAELHTGSAGPGTFAEAVRLYQRDELAKRAPKTQAEYTRQLATLSLVFGAMALDAIQPADVRDYMDARGYAIAATREKALLSAVFNFARAKRLTRAPNPCAGIHGTKAQRDRYVTDAELLDALGRADWTLAGFLELCYLTGQRPSDVTRMRRTDVQDGALHVRQAKTGAKVRLRVLGPLDDLLTRLTSHPVASVYLVRDERGQPITLAALRKRFDRLGCDWQIRDLRAKYATDIGDPVKARRGLGHRHQSTTDTYLRDRAGDLADPITRRIADKPA